MSFNGVFRSLKEVFPQVDIRVLKAVAIEHSKDVDAAVEFILSEVLPSLCAPQESLHGVSKSEKVPNRSNDVEQSRHDSSKEGDAEFSIDQRTLACDTTPDGTEDLSSVENVVMLNELTSSLNDQGAVEHDPNSYLLSKSISAQDGESSGCATNTKCDTSYVKAPCLEEALISGSFPSSLFENTHTVDTLEIEKKEMHQVGFFSPSFASSNHIDNVFGGVSSILPSESLNSVKHMVAEEELGSSPDHRCDKLNPLLKFELEPFNMAMANVDNCPPLTIATRSGQIVKTDVLEDFIIDAKIFKKTLVSTMESVLCLAKLVEDQERDALQAKDKASKAGLDVLAKVEDLKQMLTHAKEANYMHAGEVYGEKSILATEVRELQSRLLSLADEKDKSLSVIEEVRKTLESRLAAAEAEKVEAEKEKLEKEENAVRELHEQEIMMDRIVEDSKRLKQEAEENSNLREFLVDRGRIVDMLQGEISVICEDVHSLKERVDKHIPFVSLAYSGRFTLASSVSGASNQETMSNGRIESAEMSNRNDVAILVIPEPQDPKAYKEDNSSARSATVANDHKVASEDDWYMFEDADEAHPVKNA